MGGVPEEQLQKYIHLGMQNSASSTLASSLMVLTGTPVSTARSCAHPADGMGLLLPWALSPCWLGHHCLLLILLCQEGVSSACATL